MVRVRQLPLRSGQLNAPDYPSGKFCSILPFYTICDFYSQSRLNAAKAEMKKTIVGIERISDCIPKLNIAKSGFYNFESGAFNHSATLPHGRFEDSMRCVSNKYIVRAPASGASSFAVTAGCLPRTGAAIFQLAQPGGLPTFPAGGYKKQGTDFMKTKLMILATDGVAAGVGQRMCVVCGGCGGGRGRRPVTPG